MRKFMVVVDETPECAQAMRFAARRAQKTQGLVTMLYVIPPDDFQHWMGVAEVMRAEAREMAEARLSDLAEELRALTGLTPEFDIREGKPVEAVLAQIEADPDIGVLVLGAGQEDGPGPIITQLVNKMAGKLPIPVTIVPGGLTMQQIDNVC
ncbi:universal stress protein [Paralimibaculum aggregatum]|uniref:Universal stress protein n=1 Tax=Paralimibaculum aggregatum TaxID=3036245 RepID=A0ABQ6LPC8_9RHOB|nr:universal stress protein [Limibaculum sp. NKW23]GMG84264.1 universal stress protein [Limibaculum sp. NKW23]